MYEQSKILPKCGGILSSFQPSYALPVDTRTHNFNIVRTAQIIHIFTYLRALPWWRYGCPRSGPACPAWDGWLWMLFFCCECFWPTKIAERRRGPRSRGFWTQRNVWPPNSHHPHCHEFCINSTYSHLAPAAHIRMDQIWVIPLSQHIIYCSDHIISIPPHTAQVRRRKRCPLFGLSELGNVMASKPTHPALDVAHGEERCITYMQFYTSIVKADFCQFATTQSGVLC